MIDTLLHSRRTVRKFTDKKPDEQSLKKILEGALMAPSSKGSQPWEFVLVTERERLDKLSAAKSNAHALDTAPVAVVILGDPEKTDAWVEDCAIAATHIYLGAEDLGIGSCWVQIRNRLHSPGSSAEQYVRDVLEIPSSMAVECILALGYPAEEKQAHDKNRLPKGKIHKERFGSEL